jgi:hypothetical protein
MQGICRKREFHIQFYSETRMEETPWNNLGVDCRIIKKGP